MLVTSITTCMAFTATATSPLLAIKSFGLFTAIVIFLDYVYVITVRVLPGVEAPLAFSCVNRFSMALSYWRAGRLTAKNGGFRPGQWLPAATVLYNRWFENQGFCRCTCCCKPQDPDKPPEGWGKAIGTGVAIGLPLALVFSGYFFWLGGQVSQRWPIVFYGTSTSTSASARATPPPSTRAPSCSSAARWRASRACYISA